MILQALSKVSLRRLLPALVAGFIVLVLLFLAPPAVDAQNPCVPGRPLTPRVDSDRPTTITVTWLEPSNSCPAITDYDYRFKEMTDAVWTQVTDTTITRRWIEIFGLKPDTVYDVQIRARNSEGEGAWSRYGTWKTLPLPMTPTPEPTATPTPEPTEMPTPEPTATPTPEPTETPTPEPTATPTPQPTATPTPEPTATPTPQPTATPTPEPTATPTPEPTATPTPQPTAPPTPQPTATPTPEPTATATATPTPLAIWTPTPTPPATPASTATPRPQSPPPPPVTISPGPPAAEPELSDLATVLIGLAAAVESLAIGFFIAASSRRRETEGGEK